MNREFTVCGCRCSDCASFSKNECAGCEQIRGKVWWAAYINAEICPVYDCVINKHKYNDCGDCPELPCTLWYEMKDPTYSQEQHEQGIRERVRNLKSGPHPQ